MLTHVAILHTQAHSQVPPRFRLLGDAVARLFNQTRPPDTVLLVLARAYRNFANNSELSVALSLRTQDGRVDTYVCDEDVGPMSKVTGGIRSKLNPTSDGPPVCYKYTLPCVPHSRLFDFSRLL